MTGTIARTRPESRRGKALAPTIREVCLVGSARRTYVHLPADAPRIEDPGLKKARKVESC